MAGKVLKETSFDGYTAVSNPAKCRFPLMTSRSLHSTWIPETRETGRGRPSLACCTWKSLNMGICGKKHFTLGTVFISVVCIKKKNQQQEQKRKQKQKARTCNIVAYNKWNFTGFVDREMMIFLFLPSLVGLGESWWSGEMLSLCRVISRVWIAVILDVYLPTFAPSPVLCV